MSSTNCRAQFTAYLRQHSILYSVWPSHVDINDYRFQFLEQSERIIIRCGYDVPYSYSIPYCCPDTLIQKALAFHECIKKKHPYKRFLIQEKTSRKKKTGAGKTMSNRKNQEKIDNLVCM